VTTAEEARLGRGAAAIADAIRAEIESGRALPGQFLPPVRELALTHAAGSKTIWRALKALEAEGLVAAEPRQGYRVLAGAGDPDRGCPLAYVAGGDPDEWGGSTDRLLNALRDAGERRGWPLLAIGSLGRAPAQILEQLSAARAFGVALDSSMVDLGERIADSGIPTVMVNSWIRDSGLDSVMQDGQLGGMLAAEYLIERDCKRIAYFGRCNPDAHSVDRFSGAAAALAARGLDLTPELIVRVTRDSAAEKARSLLSRGTRPDGIIAPYHGSSKILASVIRREGVELGTEVHMVGWCPEELWGASWQAPLAGGPVPPVITWSVDTMAETALARITERRANPGQPPLRVKVPTRLKFAD
jgi:DNA-binding LacI/PurR family transcriptional regulator